MTGPVDGLPDLEWQPGPLPLPPREGLEALLSRAKLPYRPYHSTRHTFATWLLEAGTDIRRVQQQMGHASIGQTADTYSHVQPSRHESAVEAPDRILG